MKSTAIVSMDESGSLLLPEDVRRNAGLEPGMPLEISSSSGRVEIKPAFESEPAPQKVRIVQKGKLWVAEPLEPGGEPLTAEAVRQTQEGLRERRFED